MKLFLAASAFLLSFFSLDATKLRIINIMEEPVLVETKLHGDNAQRIGLNSREYIDIAPLDKLDSLILEQNDVLSPNLATKAKQAGTLEDVQLEIYEVGAQPTAEYKASKRGEFTYSFTPLEKAFIKGIAKNPSIWYGIFPWLAKGIDTAEIKPWEIFQAQQPTSREDIERTITPKYEQLKSQLTHAQEVLAVVEAAYQCILEPSLCERFQQIVHRDIANLPALETYEGIPSAAVRVVPAPK